MTSLSNFIMHTRPLSTGAMALPTRTRNNILAKTVVDPSTDCWLWTGARWQSGYPRIKVGGKQIGLHRFMCEAVHGLPPGYQPDHLCKVKWCINPDHLEPVTTRENTLRADGPTAINARKKLCAKGHTYDRKTSAGGRYCSICKRDSNRLLKLKKKGQVYALTF